MAIISKILSLPSATQYNPTSAPSFAIIGDFSYGTPIEYGQVDNGATPTNKVGWQEPSPAFFKNKNSSRYRFKLSSGGVVIRDELLGPYSVEGQFLQNSVGSVIAGTSYSVEIYTTANGTTLSNPNTAGFLAQTAPNISPTTDGGFSLSGSAETPEGNVITMNINSHTSNWGGVDINSLGRYYLIEIISEDGTMSYSGIPTIYNTNLDPAYSSVLPLTISTNLGRVKNNNYRIYLKAKNRAGTAPRFESPITAIFGPNNFPIIRTPSLSDITPNFGGGEGGTSVLITGVSLTTVTSVTICGIGATINSQNYDQIIATTGQRISSSSITGDVVVTNPRGTATLTNAFSYGPYNPGPFFPPPPYFGPGIY